MNRVTRTKDVYIMSKICTQDDLTACIELRKIISQIMMSARMSANKLVN
jgi:hypothetical protein